MGFLLEKLVKNEKNLLKSLGRSTVYEPRGIWHGSFLSYHSKLTLKQIELGRLDDFLEYLFEHSEHCDHITQSDAYKEFEQWEMKQAILEQKNK